MSFWQSRIGTVIDGNIDEFKIIPDGTKAVATIKDFIIKDYEGDPVYQVIWKILDGEFKSYEVRQSIRANDLDDARRDKALNMFMRLYQLCDLKPTHDNEPEADDLLPFKGKIIGITIKIFHGDKGPMNWVSGIYKADESFVPKVGDASKATNKIESAFTRQAERTNNDVFNDDILF